MHIWGPILLHPMTVPIADQLNLALVSGCKYTLTVYGAVLKPVLEDLHFLFAHLN